MKMEIQFLCLTLKTAQKEKRKKVKTDTINQKRQTFKKQQFM